MSNISYTHAYIYAYMKKLFKMLSHLSGCHKVESVEKVEKDIERYVRIEVEKMGGEMMKWVSPGNRGVPDRIILLPGGLIMFAEFKDDGGEVSSLQRYWQRRLLSMGFRSVIVDGMGHAHFLVDAIRQARESGRWVL